jgi:RimJ/RimL family protein N-acetyltransferase
VEPSTLLDPVHIGAVIDGPISHCVGPLYEGYAEADSFRPARSDAILTLDRSHVPEVQAFTAACEKSGSDVTPIWREVLHRFVSASDPADVEHSGLTRADSPLFAVVDDSAILALAHYSMWAADAASIGVLTHPAHRGRGYGKASVTTAMLDAFAHGHFVLYRTMLTNRPSVALAMSLGCRDYGRFLGVHVQEVHLICPEPMWLPCIGRQHAATRYVSVLS